MLVVADLDIVEALAVAWRAKQSELILTLCQLLDQFAAMQPIKTSDCQL